MASPMLPMDACSPALTWLGVGSGVGSGVGVGLGLGLGVGLGLGLGLGLGVGVGVGVGLGHLLLAQPALKVRLRFGEPTM